VTLSGSGSSDPDGDALSYAWRDGGGALVGSTPTLTLTLGQGTHPFSLTVTDSFGASAEDAVVVTVGDTTPPVVSVTSPVGITALTGVPLGISWTATDNSALAIFHVSYSVDGGATFLLIPGCTSLPGSARSCLWASPGPASSDARIRVSARDAAFNEGIGSSSFSLVAPAITVTAPNAPATWGIGSTQAITWTSNAGGNVEIAVSRNGGTTWTVIAAAVPNTGSFAWLVTSPTTTTARFRVRWTTNPAVSDVSDANVKIATPAVTVAVPNTNVLWTLGSTRTISWSHNLGTSATMKLEVSRDGGSSWSTINTSVPNSGASTGSFSWTVSGPRTSRARIRVTWTANTAVRDRSDVDFRIF
jgi:hypothetical protein